jgi:hypothetical protein
MGAVPFQEAKWSRLGNRAMSPISTSSRGAGGADAVQIHQRTAGGGDQLFEFLGGGLLALVDPLEVTDQLGGDASACLARGIARPHGGQQGLGLGGGQGRLGPAGDELQQQVVQLGDHPGVVLAQAATTVDHDPQHRELLVVGHRPQAGHPGPDQGDQVRVGGVGLASLTGREHTGPRGQLRRDVHHVLAACEEPVGDVPTNAVAALDPSKAVRDALLLSDSKDELLPDVLLADPLAPSGTPLEAPPTRRGHSGYMADPAMRNAIDALSIDLATPTPTNPSEGGSLMSRSRR